MSEQTEQKLHFGGVSTDIEVKALMDHFGTPAVGTILAYEDIEVVTGVERAKTRFRTVMERYRSRMEALHGIHLATLANIGYKVLSPAERVERNLNTAGQGFRRLAVAEDRLKSINRKELNTEDAKRADTAQLLLAKVGQVYSDNKPLIQAPGKAGVAPQLKVVKGQ